MEYYTDRVEMAKPLQIVETTEEHVFALDEDKLTEVLLQDEIKDRYVVVVSVAGAFRKGKSFLLDFFLRYMYSTVGHQFPLSRYTPLTLFISPFSTCTTTTSRTGWATRTSH